MNRSPESGSERDDAAFAESLRQLLRESEQALDFNATARLGAARARALDQVGRRRPWPRWTLAVPGTVAAAALAGVLLLPHFQAPQEPEGGARPLSQPELLESYVDDTDTLGLYEDLEFYQWLEETGGSA
jgi:hypothetical protein